VNLLDVHRVVLGTTNKTEKEFVLDEVRIGEVELDLLADLVGVIGLFANLGVKLDLVLPLFVGPMTRVVVVVVVVLALAL